MNKDKIYKYHMDDSDMEDIGEELDRMLNRVFAVRIQDFQKRDLCVRYHPGHFSRMKAEIISCKKYMRDNMRQPVSGVIFLDQHKLAAIVAALVLKYKPVVYMKDGNAYESAKINAIMAVFAGVEIILSFQIKNVATHEQERMHIMNEIRDMFVYPPPKEDTHSDGVLTNLTSAFLLLARKPELETSELYNILWFFSIIFFFLDIYSECAMQSLAKEAYDKIKSRV